VDGFQAILLSWKACTKGYPMLRVAKMLFFHPLSRPKSVIAELLHKLHIFLYVQLCFVDIFSSPFSFFFTVIMNYSVSTRHRQFFVMFLYFTQNLHILFSSTFLRFLALILKYFLQSSTYLTKV